MISDKKPLSLKNLFFPIFFETFLVTLTGVIDTAMVSSIGDNAVGAVGASGTYLAVINNLLSVVSVGAAAIMSRYVGAEKQRTAKRTLRIALLFNLAVGGIFSLVFALFTKQIVTAVGTAPSSTAFSSLSARMPRSSRSSLRSSL
ncbi:MAG: hypothetical protein MJ082_00055 [Clostridia bacterium]|nr:hypothetical protein [Clostridia bacterium]